MVQRGPLEVEIGHQEIEPAIAVEVGAATPIPAWYPPSALPATPAVNAIFLELKPALVAEQEVGRSVVGDVQVDPIVVVEVRRHHAQAPSIRIGESSGFGHVDETPAVIAKDVVDGPLVLGRITVVVFPSLVLAERGMVRVPADVMTDVKVEVAVAVEIGEGRGGGIVPRARPDPRARSHPRRSHRPDCGTGRNGANG